VRERQRAECVLQDPRRAIGAGIDAPGRLEVDAPPVGRADGACAESSGFRYGSGIFDITGVIANKSGAGWENPQQVMSALHTRQYSRAYAIASPCNGKRIVFVSADIGLIFGSIRQGVLEAIAEDETLSAFYGPDNFMLSATHTHAGPAGYEHGEGANLFHFGYDALVYNTIVDGVVESIRRAHANIAAHPRTGPIRLATGELLNANINRSRPAFEMNPEAERREFLNQRGEEVDVNKRVVQLDLVRDNGSAVGIINWFGVHPTVMGPTQPHVSADSKGEASLGFERIMRTRYDVPPGQDTFVAAFAQADEGDSSPAIFFRDFPPLDPRRTGGENHIESVAIHGTKQLAEALELFGTGEPLKGPVDYRFFRVPFDDIAVTDPAVLASLPHPPGLDAEDKRTCSGALGVSFGAGSTEDGHGPTVEGARCGEDPQLIEAAQQDFQTVLETRLEGFPGTWPKETIPPFLLSATAACNVTPEVLPGDYSCQAEKPVLLPRGDSVLPFQLFRIGNLAILGVPFEVTTMAARRIRRLMLEALAPDGVDTLVVAGLVNDYVHYLTTREEYASQQYEGASTLYGPWSQAAVAQESLKLARAMRDGESVPVGPQKPQTDGGVPPRPPYIPSDTAHPAGPPGTVVSDVPETAEAGQTVVAEFVAGHPRNDLRIQSSYAYVERQRDDGEWEVIATDRNPELIYDWRPLLPSPLPIDPPVIGPSTGAVIWQIPANTPAGTYRLRHEGAAQTAALVPAQEYSGTSSQFTISGPVGDCPWGSE
jgi:neutral ceramidase